MKRRVLSYQSFHYNDVVENARKELYQRSQNFTDIVREVVSKKNSTTARISGMGSSNTAKTWFDNMLMGRRGVLYNGKTHDRFFADDEILHIQHIVALNFNFTSSIASGSRMGAGTVFVDLGHDGENFVIAITSTNRKESYKLEEIIFNHLKDTYDPTYKIGDVTVRDFMEKYKGRAARKKFGM